MEANKAYAGENSSVIYEYINGKIERWSGGKRTWRNQNPGNVLYNGIKWNGMIGKAGPFCVFSTPEFGRRATRIILSNRKKESKTLAEAIHSYAPSIENDTEAYIRNVSTWTNVDRNTKLNTLSDEKMEEIAQAIFRQEGWEEGTVEVVKAARTGKYIWRTAHDEKVRKEHAQFDGEIFDFANPPPGGNPGAAYGCRCWAEPIPERSLKEILKK